MRLNTGLKPLRSFLIFTALVGSVIGQQTAKSDSHDLEFLLGHWVAEGHGGPRQGTGGFSFGPDLQGTILIRKNYADYPATKDKPGYRHDDLMVIYRDPGIKQLRAAFFDNEGHAISCSARASADGNAVEFLSDATASSPRHRLSYQKAGRDTLGLKFEIAAPGSPDSFKTYIEASTRRKNASSASVASEPNSLVWQFDTGG